MNVRGLASSMLLIGILGYAGRFACADQPAVLFPRNTEAPFCYLCGGERSWPVLSRPLGARDKVELTVRRNGEVLAAGKSATLRFEGLGIEVSRQGTLRVRASGSSRLPKFELGVVIRRGDGTRDEQVLSVMPAPPQRPVSYYADFADDLINIFGMGVVGDRQFFHHQLGSEPAVQSRFRVPHRKGNLELALDKTGFDQYFRRLQCQGVGRLILWPLPFPVLADPSSYAKEDWARFQAIAHAVINNRELTEILIREGRGKSGILTWAWIRDLLAFRLNPQIHKALGDSAVQHGIVLGLSMRPLEPAVTKYYEIPAFNDDGSFLFSYLPFASPAVNYHAEEVGFANYREVLASMGLRDEAEIGSIRIPAPGKGEAFLARYRSRGDNFRVVAADYPPLQSDSLVLQKAPDGSFRLRRFGEIAGRAYGKREIITGFELRHDPGKGLVLTGLRIPRGYRYLLMENPAGEAGLEFSTHDPALLFSRASTPLGRLQIYWSLDESTAERKKTLAAGITADGGYHSVFFASEASASCLRSETRSTLVGRTLVIDRGDAFSPEMVDYNLPDARSYALREIGSIVKHPAFREIYLNTRSHTQLAGSFADGDDGIRPKIEYLNEKKRARHLGLDLAYAPRLAASDPELRKLASEPSGLARIATWQRGEWDGFCQSVDCASSWRYVRNTGVASGVRLLLQDLTAKFPGKRLRVVVPERAAVVRAVEDGSRQFPREAVSYAGSRNNYIQNIGEGMAVLDLSGLKVEPVLLGTGPFVDMRILNAFLDHSLADTAGNHGSLYRGPKGIMYEGQWTLKKQLTTYRPAGWSPEGDRAREERMCAMLSRQDVSEVIVYEAADWIYSLSLDDPFRFLETCLQKSKAAREAGR